MSSFSAIAARDASARPSDAFSFSWLEVGEKNRDPIPMSTVSGSTRLTLLLMAGFVSSAGAAPDFEREVAPILEAKCLFCHNAESKKGKFDLSAAAVRSHASFSEILDLVSGPSPRCRRTSLPSLRTR